MSIGEKRTGGYKPPNFEYDSGEPEIEGSDVEMDDMEAQFGEGRRRLMESEEIGASILSDLHRQRERLFATRGSLGEVDQELYASNSILRWMGLRKMTERCVCYAMIAFFIAIIVVVLGFKVVNG
mmetsp:Transcript_33754/g.46739  ORF Transcript_33754/g.46739 Transcript_33754/m.46739 type:complete len:125 (+) Transcript_33754:153-527(+)